MNKSIFFMGALALGTSCVSAQKEEARPNIIIILTDDMGYSDLGCFGGLIKTPNLDRLAQNGLRYMQFYNTARSCPTRACILTGLYPHQAGVGHMMEDRDEDGYRGDLNDNCVTIGEVLQGAGYSTYAVGKWHVSRNIAPEGPSKNWPLQRGFDRYYGTLAGSASYYDPAALCRGNSFITPENDPEYKPEKFYYTTAITDNAIRYIDEHKALSPDKPFFMYLAYTAAHWPMQVPEEYVEPYKGAFAKGWDQLRRQKYRRMVDEGIIKKQWALSFDTTVENWDSDVKDQAFEQRCMEVYAGMISCLDQSIGRVIEDLRRNGQLDNTLIMFIQDNGGCAETVGRITKPQNKPIPDGEVMGKMNPDELQMYSKPYRTRDGRHVREGYGVMPGAEDTYVAYGKGWAYLSDTPFREYKHWVHEGGISTPLIVHYPAGIKDKGAMRWQPGHIIDVMATCVDFAAADYPETKNGNSIKPMEGMSLRESFKKDMTDYNRALYWEHEGNRAIRKGEWKLVYKGKTRNDGDITLDKWELYNMESDRTETNNVAVQNPDIVKAMAEEWEQYALRCNVKPWPKKQSNVK